MRLLRVAVVGLCVALVAARYLRERARLRAVERLTGVEGLRYLEATRMRTDRVLPIVTAMFVAGAIAAVAHLVWTR